MKKENKSFAIHSVVGIFAGLVSFFLKDRLTVLISIIVVEAILVKVLEKYLGKENAKWWISNGIWIYVFVWFISWSVFYNLF